MDKELSYSFPSDSQMDSKVLPHVTVVKGAMDADEVFLVQAVKNVSIKVNKVIRNNNFFFIVKASKNNKILNETRICKLLWCSAFVFVECFYEITFVVKTTGNGDFLDGNIFCGKHLAGAFDSIIVQIVNRCTACYVAEIPTEIFWIHSGYFRQGV